MNKISLYPVVEWYGHSAEKMIYPNSTGKEKVPQDTMDR